MEKRELGKEHTGLGTKGCAPIPAVLQKMITDAASDQFLGVRGRGSHNKTSIRCQHLHFTGGKLRLKDAEGLDLGHPAREYQKHSSNPGPAAPKPEPWNCNLYEALTVRCK